MFWLLPLNFTLAVASLGLLLVTVVLYADYFFYKGKYLGDVIKERAAWLMVIVVSVASTILSLVYSEYFGFIPCSLCWLQRIATYPQVLSILAFYKGDNRWFPLYGIWLSVFGLIVAGYQYIYQMLPKEALSSGLVPCLADGSNADCAVKVINEFGFVTFPLIAAITFAFLIIVYLYLLRSKKAELVTIS